ncbi:hypothetical protein CC80DRAFT_488357 [Byssothecium circinans]|uniref:Uncharacterized protein n=1 Tax=Byssothecium circinans TaxID=147558 RepID=A0A6A5UBA4_9PLEO|nr:hypothetical protein CC80DRAFT_488357 [Byssothecium circinans]
MRFLPLIPLLAATAFAADAESSSSSAAASSSSEVPEEPTPVGQLWTAQWKDSDVTSSYNKKCASSSTYKAQIYTLGEMYPALKTWAPELKVFYHKQLYPGSWNGEDIHGEGRALLKMDYEELPFAVREWLQRNPKQRHFSVQEDVVFFAPGAIYPIAPLWVEEPEAKTKSALGECEGVFEDLENYSATPKDGVVLGRVSHEKKGKNEVEFSIEAFQVEEKKAGAKDEL